MSLESEMMVCIDITYWNSPWNRLKYRALLCLHSKEAVGQLHNWALLDQQIEGLREATKYLPQPVGPFLFHSLAFTLSILNFII